MPDVRLSKSEMAALDLLIAQMEEEQAVTSGAELFYTAITARIARVLVTNYTWNRALILTALTRQTPMIADIPVASRAQAEATQLAGAAGGVTAGLSLNDLVELRKQAVLEEAPKTGG